MLKTLQGAETQRDPQVNAAKTRLVPRFEKPSPGSEMHTHLLACSLLGGRCLLYNTLELRGESQFLKDVTYLIFSFDFLHPREGRICCHFNSINSV